MEVGERVGAEYFDGAAEFISTSPSYVGLSTPLSVSPDTCASLLVAAAAPLALFLFAFE